MSPSGAARHSVPTPGEGAGSEGCAHCGLPCGTSAFCCYGCELARDLARESEEDGHRRAGLLTLSLLLSMVVMMLSLFLYAEDIYEATNDPFFAWLRGVYRGASALLATPVVLLLGVPLGKSALHRLRHGEVSMELLVLVGASAAWLASLWSLWRGGSAIYFDSAVAALVLATFGRYLEA
ncbi:MAG: hypothetical protein KC731_12835, partial [Myxococcales bacterium]|nr:hypothetical protein [Myxococcales bacterium]